MVGSQMFVGLCIFYTYIYIPSGKRLHNELERSTMFNGKIHYFDWVIFNSYVKLPEGTYIFTLHFRN